uniref:hypothetical protein n=1 Tax=Mariniflexile sp. TaxID=1979402 RepID=UPI0040481810
MNKTESIQLFSKMICQNEELTKLVLKTMAQQSEILERQVALRKGQEKLIKNQIVIWEKLNQMD